MFGLFWPFFELFRRRMNTEFGSTRVVCFAVTKKSDEEKGGNGVSRTLRTCSDWGRGAAFNFKRGGGKKEIGPSVMDGRQRNWGGAFRVVRIKVAQMIKGKILGTPQNGTMTSAKMSNDSS